MANELQSTSLGHAYLIAGGAEQIALVLSFLKERGIETEGNPDVYIREYKSFGIEDARELRDRAQTRAIAGERRIFIVTAPGMTTDAQNALLKTLEEPPAGAVFFFIVPSPLSLISTLRSRAHLLALPPSRRSLDGRSNSSVIDIAEFLSAAPEQRLEMLKPLYQKDEDEERDIRQAILFLTGLETLLATGKQTPTSGKGIKALYLARKYISDKGSLLKPLLEQVALLVPRVV